MAQRLLCAVAGWELPGFRLDVELSRWPGAKRHSVCPEKDAAKASQPEALPGCVASSIQGRDLVRIPLGLLERPRAKGADATGSQVKWGQLLPGAKAPPYTFLSGNETVLPPHPRGEGRGQGGESLF